MPYLIYPERRQVSDHQIRSWFADRMLDEMLATFVGPLQEDAYAAMWQDLCNTPTKDAMAYLSDCGVVFRPLEAPRPANAGPGFDEANPPQHSLPYYVANKRLKEGE